MIERIGFDLVEVPRIARALRNPRFLPRIFTPLEIASMGEADAERVAGRWAAKEAVIKALGTPLRWHEVEITTRPNGQPEAHVRGGNMRPDQRLHVSISHERSMAGAIVVLERGAFRRDPL